MDKRCLNNMPDSALIDLVGDLFGIDDLVLRTGKNECATAGMKRFPVVEEGGKKFYSGAIQLPGLSKDNLKATIKDDVLRVEATYAKDDVLGRSGTAVYSIYMKGVDKDNIQLKMVEGVLVVKGFFKAVSQGVEINIG